MLAIVLFPNQVLADQSIGAIPPTQLAKPRRNRLARAECMTQVVACSNPRLAVFYRHYLARQRLTPIPDDENAGTLEAMAWELEGLIAHLLVLISCAGERGESRHLSQITEHEAT